MPFRGCAVLGTRCCCAGRAASRQLPCVCCYCRPYNDFWAVEEYGLTAVFMIDFVLQFFRAFHDPETAVLVTQKGRIARHYVTRCGAGQ